MTEKIVDVDEKHMTYKLFSIYAICSIFIQFKIDQ